MVTDHLGNEFKTKTEMCNHYGVDRNRFNDRIKRGYSVERALNKGRITERMGKKGVSCVDHHGNTFATKKDMCTHYGIDRTTFNARIKKGWTIEKALTTPLRKKKIQDHNGVCYESLELMCEEYHITKEVYVLRETKGYTLKERLCGIAGQSVVDDKGYRYDTLDEMCTMYGINKSTFRTRKRRGASLKECLYGVGVDDESKDIFVINKYFGTSFLSIRQACHHNGMAAHVYRNRRKKGYSIEESIGIVPLIGKYISNHVINDGLTVQHNIMQQYFLCIRNGEETIMTHDEIIDYYRQNILEIAI